MTSFIVSQLTDGYLIAALPLAFAAGLISFLTPCVLPLVPGYLSFAAGFSRARGKVFLGSLLFVLGFSALFISYGAIFGGLGAYVSVNNGVIIRVLGVFTIALGVIFLGTFPMMPTLRPKISTTGGLLGAPLLGFLFGVGWTPCIGPALATVLSLGFQQSSAARGAILAFGYCLGLGLPFIATGLFLDKSNSMRKFMARRGNIITQIGGVSMIIIGVLQLSGLWTSLMIDLRGVIANFAPVL